MNSVRFLGAFLSRSLAVLMAMVLAGDPGLAQASQTHQSAFRLQQVDLFSAEAIPARLLSNPTGVRKRRPMTPDKTTWHKLQLVKRKTPAAPVRSLTGQPRIGPYELSEDAILSIMADIVLYEKWLRTKMDNVHIIDAYLYGDISLNTAAAHYAKAQNWPHSFTAKSALVAVGIAAKYKLDSEGIISVFSSLLFSRSEEPNVISIPMASETEIIMSRFDRGASKRILKEAKEYFAGTLPKAPTPGTQGADRVKSNATARNLGQAFWYFGGIFIEEVLGHAKRAKELNSEQEVIAVTDPYHPFTNIPWLSRAHTEKAIADKDSRYFREAEDIVNAGQRALKKYFTIFGLSALGTLLSAGTLIAYMQSFTPWSHDVVLGLAMVFAFMGILNAYLAISTYVVSRLNSRKGSPDLQQASYYRMQQEWIEVADKRGFNTTDEVIDAFWLPYKIVQVTRGRRQGEVGVVLGQVAGGFELFFGPTEPGSLGTQEVISAAYVVPAFAEVYSPLINSLQRSGRPLYKAENFMREEKDRAGRFIQSLNFTSELVKGLKAGISLPKSPENVRSNARVFPDTAERRLRRMFKARFGSQNIPSYLPSLIEHFGAVPLFEMYERVGNAFIGIVDALDRIVRRQPGQTAYHEDLVQELASTFETQSSYGALQQAVYNAALAAAQRALLPTRPAFVPGEILSYEDFLSRVRHHIGDETARLTLQWYSYSGLFMGYVFLLTSNLDLDLELFLVQLARSTKSPPKSLAFEFIRVATDFYTPFVEHTVVDFEVVPRHRLLELPDGRTVHEGDILTGAGLKALIIHFIDTTRTELLVLLPGDRSLNIREDSLKESLSLLDEFLPVLVGGVSAPVALSEILMQVEQILQRRPRAYKEWTLKVGNIHTALPRAA